MRLVTATLEGVAVAVLAALALAYGQGGLTVRGALLALALGSFMASVSLWLVRREPEEFSRPGPWEWAAIVVFALVSLRAFLWVVFQTGDEIRVLSPNNLGDMSLHVTYVRQMAHGVPFWPDNPILSGAKLTYPLGVDLLHSLLFLAGVDLWRGFVWMGLAGALLTGAALWQWGRGFTIAGFLGNGGLAAFVFTRHWHLMDFQAQLGWKSFVLALFVTQRGLLFALPAGLVLLCSWRWRFFGQGRRVLPWWGELLLYAVMPVFHLHTFIALSLVLGAWFLLRAQARREIALLVGAALVPATVLVLLVTARLHAPSVIGWAPGWMQSDEDYLKWYRSAFGGDAGARFFFWLLNFGLFPLAVAYLLWRPRDARTVAFCVPAVGLFLLCCLVKFAPWPWDNTKLMIWSYLLLLPPLWEEVVAPCPLWGRVALVAALFGSGLLSTVGGLGGTGYRMATASEVALVESGLRRVPATARFVAQPTYNHPLLLNGRPLALGYTGHVWSHGYQYEKPWAEVNQVLDGATGWRETAARLGCRYLYWGTEEQAAHGNSAQPWKSEAKLIASGEWGDVYDLEARP